VFPFLPAFHHSNTPLLHHSSFLYLSIYIEQHWKNISPIQLLSPGITGILRRTVGGASGFEERRKGERFKLSLPVQLKNGTGITCDISTSGIFFETESAYSIGDTITRRAKICRSVRKGETNHGNSQM
jgi:hypothetical protein